ncbi:MAG: hypothetical protein R3240_03170, partial [Gammaproteobacteria bacterium]|nr:hypothetical protein [Gammaproteobacteria bacterium]
MSRINNNVKHSLVASLVALSGLGLTSTSQADDYHYINMLIGDRASGLGGSYVSIADDPSGLYYNPAGIVYSASGNISANMNAYNLTRTEYKNALGGKSWIRNSSALVPNFFGITQPLGPGTIGFSYAITDSILEDQAQTFNDIPFAGSKFTINFNNQDTTNNVGPSYAIAFGKNFSIGLTLYGFMRTQERIVNQNFEFSKVTLTDSTTGETIVDPDTGDAVLYDHFHSQNQYITKKEYGIKPILGIMYSPMDNISLGLSIRKVFLVQSTFTSQEVEATNFCADATDKRCDQPTFKLVKGSSNIQRTLPWEMSIGGTWFVNNKLLLTGTGWIYQAINNTSRPLINVAGGLEYYITGKFAMRLGGYTNLANTPKLQSGTNIYNEHVDIVGASASLSHFTRTSSITFGAAGS